MTEEQEPALNSTLLPEPTENKVQAFTVDRPNFDDVAEEVEVTTGDVVVQEAIFADTPTLEASKETEEQAEVAVLVDVAVLADKKALHETEAVPANRLVAAEEAIKEEETKTALELFAETAADVLVNEAEEAAVSDCLVTLAEEVDKRLLFRTEAEEVFAEDVAEPVTTRVVPVVVPVEESLEEPEED